MLRKSVHKYIRHLNYTTIQPIKEAHFKLLHKTDPSNVFLAKFTEDSSCTLLFRHTAASHVWLCSAMFLPPTYASFLFCLFLFPFFFSMLSFHLLTAVIKFYKSIPCFVLFLFICLS